MRESPFHWLLVGVALFAAAYIALDLNALHALRTNQNTGLYLQMLVNFVQHGSTFDQPDGRPHLAVHDQWLVLAIAPLVALWPRPETMIVVQVIALALSALPLYGLARSCGARPALAAVLGFIWLASPSVQGWAYFGFVPEHFIPLLAFSLALAIRHRKIVAVAILTELLLGIKEDEGWFLAWIGVVGVLFYDRLLGGIVAGLAAINGVVYDAAEVHFGFVPERPAYGMVDRELGQQIAFLAEILAPFAFAPLSLGVRVAVALPMLVELFFAQHRDYAMYRAGYYYTEPLVTLMAIGAAVAIGRRPRFIRYAVVTCAIMAVFFSTPRRCASDGGLFRLIRSMRRRGHGRQAGCPSISLARTREHGRSLRRIPRRDSSAAARHYPALAPHGSTSRSIPPPLGHAAPTIRFNNEAPPFPMKRPRDPVR